jgi:hypothetical protein
MLLLLCEERMKDVKGLITTWRSGFDFITLAENYASEMVSECPRIPNSLDKKCSNHMNYLREVEERITISHQTIDQIEIDEFTLQTDPDYKKQEDQS